MNRTEALPTMPMLLPTASIPRTEPGLLPAAPVLIRVPHARPIPTRRLNSARSTATSWRARGIRSRRRRLRRPIRVAGYALFALLPSLLAWSCLTDAQWTRQPSGRLFSPSAHLSKHEKLDGGLDPGAWSSSSAARASGSLILLSIEPVGTAADSDNETPVVFPGYLLPDDHHEEPIHEGS
jgi:hypothetical protein